VVRWQKAVASGIILVVPYRVVHTGFFLRVLYTFQHVKSCYPCSQLARMETMCRTKRKTLPNGLHPDT
jgi:hypothetical protein